MVSVNQIDTSFTQQRMSCVLASYAVAANYFAGTPIKDVFTAYCDHFGIVYKDEIEAENISAIHLNNECQKKAWQGYRMVRTLHETSTQPIFKKHREKFIIVKQGVAPPSKEEQQELATVIQNEDALINLLILGPGGAHSFTIGIDIENGKEFLRDTGGVREILYRPQTFIDDAVKEYMAYRSIGTK